MPFHLRRVKPILEGLDACPAEDALTDLAAGRLAAAVTERIHGHARGCEACRRALAALEQSLPDAGGGAPDDQFLLAPGERIGRFEVLQFLGMGSMGAIFSARDTGLDRTVALKTVRGEKAGEAGLKRLVREAQAMAQLAHPNVVAVHELVEQGDRLFLAMELVGGGTLRAWLSARTRTLDEILDAFVHAGRGLAAAHAAGLVHRDFKPDNVLVDDAGRVRVTDFGLARPTGQAKPALGSPELPPGGIILTRSGTLVGTPAYMSPEQMRGEPTDARADIFAFCTSLFEALYGVRPFAGTTLAELRQRAEANDVSAPPSGRALPGWLRQILLKGLRAAPAERWDSMDGLLETIARGRARSARRRLLPWAIGGALLIATAMAGTAFVAQRRAPRSTQGTGQRRSVAVLGPRNASSRPEAAWLSGALAEMLVSELAAGEQLRLVPGRAVALAVADLGLAGAKEPGAEDLRRLRDSLGVDLIVGGSYLAPATGPIRLDLRVYDARSGEILTAVAETAREGRLFELVGRAGTRLRQELRIDANVPPEAASGSFPRDPEAERLLAEGVASLNASRPSDAVGSLTRAATIAPGSARVHAALAEAYATLRDLANARASAKRALATGGLNREERLRIERIMESPAGKDWHRAVEISRALWTFFPDDIGYALKLISDLGAAQRYDEARAVVAQMRKLPPPLGQDVRIEIAEAAVAFSSGDLKLAQAAAARAVEASRTSGNLRQLAQAKRLEGSTLARLGDPAAGTAALVEAERIAQKTGDRDVARRASLELAAIAAAAGDHGEARRRYQEALADDRARGDVGGEALILNNLISVLRPMHLIPEALAALDRSLFLSRQLGRPLNTASGLLNRGLLLMDDGQLDQAAASFEEAEKLLRANNGKLMTPIAVEARAEAVLFRGDLVRARPLCEQALAEAGDQKEVQGIAYLCLARVELAADRAPAAEQQAARAAALFGASGNVDNEAECRSVRALALLALGKLADAAKEAGQARAVIARSQGPTVRAEVGIASARVQAAQPGQLQAAIAALREVAREAEKTGSASDRLEARLALAQLLARDGKSDGRAALEAVERDASARGFALIARDAARARQARAAR